MKDIIGKFDDGGPVFTYTILVLLLIIIVLFVKAILEKDYSKKSRSILASVGWLALAWGYMGRTFGLIMAFDNIAAAGEFVPQHMAGGLKMALIGPLCGITAFLLARLGILILQLKSRNESYE
ncbi:MAG: MotA/TolQ/ExbB proton channel family protein [Bacteroidales bacterium]|nr:MotA/TolQ/ExbB proton channel family protein [Bacteroidales bacterium]